MIDVIYSGCIPVFITYSTHFPFMDIIDFHNFAIFIEENQIEDIEDRLLAIPDETLVQMQMNMLRVRDFFLYV
jgi:hypothetical protein